MNDEHEISFSGNVATVKNIGYNQLNSYLRAYAINQVCCTLDEAAYTWTISFPMTEAHREMYAPLIHRHNNELKKVNQTIDKSSSKPDNEPPPPNNGGSPAGGVILEFVNTEAKAA